jgi:hypothetical protein
MFITLDIGAMPSIRINGDKTTSSAIINAKSVNLWILFFSTTNTLLFSRNKRRVYKKTEKPNQKKMVGCTSEIRYISLRQF